MEEQEVDFNKPLIDFLSSLRSIEKTVTVVIPHLNRWLETETSEIKKEINHLQSQKSATGEDEPEIVARLFELTVKMSEYSHLDQRAVIFESLYTQLFSKFDAFTGDLIKAIYKKNPELFLSNDGSVSISTIKKFTSIEDLLDNELLQEVENFRRKSYSDQFTSLEKKFDVKLIDFEEWPQFIEASQRRNLIIHNNGIVNQQYLQVCKNSYKNKEKSKHLDSLEINTKLEVGPKEFRSTLILIKKVAFMLTHTLWRKLFPKETIAAHDACNDLIFDYLCRKLWHIAAEFGSFAISRNMTQGIDETNLKFRTVNLAIAYKFSKQNDKCEALINSIDWKTSNRDFRLAAALLKDEKSIVIDLMEKIGPQGDYISEIAYRSWPLFHEMKNDSDFTKTFEKIYNRKYFVEAVPDPTAAEAEKSPTALSNQPISIFGSPQNSTQEDIAILRTSDKERSADSVEVAVDAEAAAVIEAVATVEAEALLEVATAVEAVTHSFSESMRTSATTDGT
ncbi:hypothetical protein KV708_08430 [Comamonas thiooxydans]|uniref:hypothetical protein n=1 Tax=Comamonas thiooxydans TaxID=363952 RepID=UPI000A6D6912|nr:hypothetical protein [Comamonas thiooxydans]